MTTRGTKVLLSLLAVATLGFSMANAYTFFVENRNPFGALNLTKLIIKASPDAQTGMELSNFKLQINTAGGQLNVHKICDENGEHCRDVDVLYTGTQGNQGPQGNTGAHVVTGYVSGNDIVFGLSDDSTITLANVISQISSTGPQGDTGAQGATGASIVAGEVSGNNIIFTLSDDTKITIQDIIQTITGPQGNTGANGTGIHHISTGYDEENGITTVNIYYTTDTETPAVSFQIHDGTDGVGGNLDPDDFDWIYALFRLNDANHSGYVSAPGEGNSGKVRKTSADGTPSWQDDATGGYELPVANENDLGGIKVGYNTNPTARKYAVELDNNDNAFVNVPWEASEGTEINGIPNGWCIYECIGEQSVTIEWDCENARKKDKCNEQKATYEGSCEPYSTDASCISLALQIKENETTEKDTWFKDFILDYGDCGVNCSQNAPSGGGIPVTHYLSGKVCRYITPDILDEIANLTKGLKFSFVDADIAAEGEIRCVFNDETGSTQSQQSITINGDGGPNLLCYKSSEEANTIDCSIPIDSIQGGGGGGDSSNLWIHNNGTTYPSGYSTTNVAIGTSISGGYTLYVNGSGRFSKLNVGNNLFIKSSDQRREFQPRRTTIDQMPAQRSPMVSYSNDLVIRQQTGLSRSNDYFMIGDYGNVGIGGESSNGDIKLSVYGNTRIYSPYLHSSNSLTDRYIDLYNDGSRSYIISKRSSLYIGLTGEQGWVGAPLPSANIQFGRDAIGINKMPTQNTYNPNPPVGFSAYVPRFQVNGSIQISSEFQPTNSTSRIGKFQCRAEIEGTIAYWSGNFYGCVKSSNGSHHRRSFDTTSFSNDSLPALPQQEGVL